MISFLIRNCLQPKLLKYLHQKAKFLFFCHLSISFTISMSFFFPHLILLSHCIFSFPELSFSHSIVFDFSFQSYLTFLITKASVKIFPRAFFSKLSYLMGITFWKQCLYFISGTQSWSL